MSPTTVVPSKPDEVPIKNSSSLGTIANCSFLSGSKESPLPTFTLSVPSVCCSRPSPATSPLILSLVTALSAMSAVVMVRSKISSVLTAPVAISAALMLPSAILSEVTASAASFALLIPPLATCTISDAISSEVPSTLMSTAPVPVFAPRP